MNLNPDQTRLGDINNKISADLLVERMRDNSKQRPVKRGRREAKAEYSKLSSTLVPVL